MSSFEMIFFVLFVSGIVFGAFCAYLAKQKKRDAGAWFFLGFFFSLIALIAIAASPPRTQEEIDKEKQKWIEELGKYRKENPATPTSKAYKIFVILIIVFIVGFVAISFLMDALKK